MRQELEDLDAPSTPSRRPEKTIGRATGLEPLADDLPAPSWRRRAFVLLLALATASTVMAMLIWRPGDPKRGLVVARPLPSSAQPASAVGGPARVRLVPASSPAP